MDEEKNLAESQSAEAVQAASVAAEAIEKARIAQLKQAISESEDRTLRTMTSALREVFGAHKKFDEIDKRGTSGVSINVIANDIKYIKDDILEIKLKLESKYVTQEEFKPIRNLMYGLVGLILIAFVGSIISLVIKTQT